MSLLVHKLVRDARRSWVQFAAVALTLALGVAVFGAAFDSYRNLKASYGEVYRRLALADMTITGGSPDAVGTAVQGISGVAGTARRTVVDVPFRVRDRGAGGAVRSLQGRLVGQPDHGAATIDRIQVDQGEAVGSAGGLVAEQHMADHFHLRVGDRIEVFTGGSWHPLPIVGIAVSPEYLWPARSRQDLLSSADDFGVAFSTEAQLAALGAATQPQVLVRYDAGADRPTLDAQVRQVALARGAGDAQTRAQQPSNAALQQDVQGFAELAILFPLLFLAAAGLCTYVLLGRLVRSQRGAIGMLAANGYPGGRVVRHYMGFGAAVGLVGGGVGALGGMWLAVVLTHTYTASLKIPLAVAHVHPLTPLVGLLAGTLAATVSAAAPARAATRVAPAEAMRGTAPTGRARRSPIERIPGLRGLPLRIRLALRNAQRNPRRSASTGLGVALAAVLVLSSLGMLDTVSLVVSRQFHTVQRQDAQLYVAPSSADAAARAVRAVPGVATVEHAVEAPVVLAHGSHRYQTVLTGFPPGTGMHRFPDGLPRAGVVLGSALSSALHVGVGDTVQLSAGGAPPRAAKVAGFVDEPLGSLAYASLAQATSLAGPAAVPSLLVRYTPGADAAALRARLQAVPGVLAVRDTAGSVAAVRQLMSLFYSIVGVMLLFGSVMAFVVLFNTLAVNLSERTVELATLRAAGARVATLARLCTGENLVLVVATIPVGLLAGYAVGQWFMSSFDSDLFNFSLQLRPGTPLYVAIALVGLTLLSHVAARRGVRRLDVARVVRERAV